MADCLKLVLDQKVCLFLSSLIAFLQVEHAVEFSLQERLDTDDPS